jgi:hypothetical protein
MEEIIMSISLIAAAILTFTVGVLHSWLGEYRLIGPLLAPDNRHGLLVHDFARFVLRFAWHLTTVTWWAFAIILGLMAFSPVGETGRMILVVIAALFLAMGSFTLVTSRGRHVSWPFFLAIGLLSLVPLL